MSEPMLLLLLLAGYPAEPLPTAVEATQFEVVVPAGRSVRAVTIAGMPRLPDQPLSVRLACDVFSGQGEPRRCIPADALHGAATWSAFDAACEAFAKEMNAPGADPAVRAAYERARAVRVRARRGDEHPARNLMLFTETIAASDAAAPLPPAEAIAVADVTLEDVGGGVTMNDLYPEAALRKEAEAQVAVTCRIEDGGALLCRDAQVVWSRKADAAMARLLVLVTYQFTTLKRVAPLTRDGRPAYGKDLKLKVGWRIDPRS